MNDVKPGRCLNIHLIKTCLSWYIKYPTEQRGIAHPLLFRNIVCPTTLEMTLLDSEKVDLNKDPNTITTVLTLASYLVQLISDDIS